MDDLQIIELFFERDEKAIKETENKYGNLCFSIAQSILGNDLDTEECVNDTYLSLWNTIPPQRPNNFTAFISKITRNISLKRIRFDNAVKRSALTVISISELEDIASDQSYADIEEQKLGELINDFLRAEKKENRIVFVRKYWFYDTVSEIAVKYSFSEDKVKSMLYRTRKKLKEYLKERGVFL